MKFYAVYDENDLIAGVFETIKELSIWFGISSDCVSCAISKHNLVKNKRNGGKYHIYRILGD